MDTTLSILFILETTLELGCPMINVWNSTLSFSSILNGIFFLNGIPLITLVCILMHKRVPIVPTNAWARTRSFFTSTSVRCPVVLAALWLYLAPSLCLLVHWDVCSCPEQLKEKTHGCHGKGKKKSLAWVKGIVFSLRGHAQQKYHIEKWR